MCNNDMHTEMDWPRGKRTSNFYGKNDLEEFLINFESYVLENQRLLVLYITLKETPTRWWGTHK
jgi:hypothetical protein